MKTESYDDDGTRRTLIAMIVSRPVLARIASFWKDGYLPFASKESNVIGKMCVDHFRRFGVAPKKDIIERMARWHERRGHDKAAKEMINSLVKSLSGEYERAEEDVNPEVAVESAQHLFAKNALRRLSDEIAAALDAGDLDRAEEVRQSFARVELGAKEGTYLENREIWEAAFAEPDESIIEYTGGLKEFFGHVLTRDTFFAFMGAEKRGKSWWLADMAWHAMSQRLRVAYFQAGDQSRNQVIRRLAVRSARRPRRPGNIVLPLGIRFDPADKRAYPTETKEKTYNNHLNCKYAYESYLAKLEKIRSRGELFWLTCYGADSLSVDKIKSIIEFRSQTEGWNPDVVIVDYADILMAPPASRKLDERGQIHSTWVKLKNLSTELHCLVVTATQIKADGYRADLLTMGHFSEDKRKFSHVDGMVGINMDAKEKNRSAYRLNWLALRDGEFNTWRPVYTLGCLAIGNPAIKSVYPTWDEIHQGEE